jgi:hypothetical protein
MRTKEEKRVYDAARWANQTPEQRAEYYAKKSARMAKWYAGMTPEQKAEHLVKQSVATAKWLASMTHEQRVEYAAKKAAATTKWRIQNPVAKLISGAKNRAKTKNILFDLEQYIPELEIQYAKGCALSGLPFAAGTSERVGPYAASIDRIDSKKGYVFENVRLVRWVYNAAFSTWGEEVARQAFKVLEAKCSDGN